MPSSSSSSSDDDDSSSGDKKGARKSMELAAVTSFFGDEKKMKKVAAVVARKLSSKGKVGPKVLKRIAASKLGMTEEQLTSMAMRRLREKVRHMCGVHRGQILTMQGRASMLFIRPRSFFMPDLVRYEQCCPNIPVSPIVLQLVVESGVGKIDGKKIRSKLESD